MQFHLHPQGAPLFSAYFLGLGENGGWAFSVTLAGLRPWAPGCGLSLPFLI